MVWQLFLQTLVRHVFRFDASWLEMIKVNHRAGRRRVSVDRSVHGGETGWVSGPRGPAVNTAFLAARSRSVRGFPLKATAAGRELSVCHTAPASWWLVAHKHRLSVPVRVLTAGPLVHWYTATLVHCCSETHHYEDQLLITPTYSEDWWPSQTCAGCKVVDLPSSRLLANWPWGQIACVWIECGGGEPEGYFALIWCSTTTFISLVNTDHVVFFLGNFCF